MSEEDFPYKWDLNRHSKNPVLSAIPGTWEATWFVVDDVIRINGKLYMYYSGSDESSNRKSQLGLALSEDGIIWTRYKGNPIWKLGNWDNFLRDVRVYQFGGQELWLYYSDGDQHIDLAHSTDGIHWEKSRHNPILEVSQDWEYHVMQESVLKIDDQWYMWYSTYGGRKPRVTGMATSKDGINWSKHEDNPVLPLGKPGEWDDYSAFQPYVFYQDGYFHMIYTGSSKEVGTDYACGYALSEDGIHWVKSPDNPIIGPGPEGAWDAGKVSTHVVWRTGSDTYNIYYNGAPSPGATYVGIGLVQGQLMKVDGHN
ncbi:hypothetical protein ACFL6S_11070 [Candidatus Poribacteria bacterium]